MKTAFLGCCILALATGFFSCQPDDTTEEQNQVELSLESGEITGVLNIPDKHDEPGKVDYVLNNDLYISGQVSIAAGVIIEVGYGHRIEIEGEKAHLTCSGAAGNPVIFRGTEKSAGHWLGIRFVDANSRKNSFTYTEVHHGGNAEWNSESGASNILVDFNLQNSYLSLQNCVVAESGGVGLIVSNDDHSVDITNCDFVNNGLHPVEAPSQVVHDFSSTNSFVGNGKEAVFILSVIDASAAMQFNKLSNAGAYYLIPSGLDFSGPCTIEPGVTMKFSSGSYLHVQGENAYLSSIGTESEPIVLTGTENLAGLWNGVEISDCVSAKNQLAYTTISYAGGQDLGAAQPANFTLDFYLSEAKAEVNNCTFSHSAGYGLAVDYECTVNNNNEGVEAANSFNDNSTGNVFISE